MFGNIKRKLTDVIQEGLLLSENLPGGGTLSKSSSLSNLNINVQSSSSSVPSDINLNAGCSLLQKNEEIWKEIHETNEKNAKMAQKIGQDITRIQKNSEITYIDLKDLNYCLLQIPSIENNLKTCLDVLRSIQQQSILLDEKLLNLEDSCEEIELQEKKLEHKVKLSKYKQEKMNQLEVVRLKLASQHVENLRKYEESLKKIQEERQAVFQKAFEFDLQLFKEKGAIPKVERVERNITKELLLEEINLDSTDSHKDLEDFLNASDASD